MTATASHPRLRAVGRLVLLVAAIALTVWGISLVAFSNSMRDTRVGIPIAFWGVLFGYAAIRMGNSRTAAPEPAEEGSSDAAGELEPPTSSELVRERDEAARREYEIRLELMLRRELEAGMREELAALRRDVAELRGDVLDAVDGRLRMERVEITRIIGSNLAALHDDGLISLNPAAAELTVPAPGPSDPVTWRAAEAGRDPAALSPWTATKASAGAAEPSTRWASQASADSPARPAARSDLDDQPDRSGPWTGSGYDGLTERGDSVPAAAESWAEPSTVSATTPSLDSTGATTSSPDPSAEPSAVLFSAPALRSRESPADSSAGTSINPAPESSPEPSPEPSSAFDDTDQDPGPAPEIGVGTVTAADADHVENGVGPGGDPSSLVTVRSDSGGLTMAGVSRPSTEAGPDASSAPAAGADETAATVGSVPAGDPFADLPRLSSFRLPDLPEGVSAEPMPVPTAPAGPAPVPAEPTAARPSGGYVGRRRHAADEDPQTPEAPSVGRHGAARGERTASPGSGQSGRVPASRHRG